MITQPIQYGGPTTCAMKIALHAGAHCTNEDRLLKCLLRNAESLVARNVGVPGPGRYRRTLTEALARVDEGRHAVDAGEALLEDILDGRSGEVERLVLSHPDLFNRKRYAIRQDRFYLGAERVLDQMCRLFPDAEVELFLAIRNPATFLPATGILDRSAKIEDIALGVDARSLRWSELVTRVRAAVPQVRVTAWCDEDTPLMWGEIVRAVAGLPSGQKIVGAFDMLAEVMSADGMRRFRAYLAAHPVMSEPQKRRVMRAFLERFGLPEKLEEEIDVPGWTEETVVELTALYDADVDSLERIDGVRVLLP